MPAFQAKLSLCGHLGRLDEAKQCLALFREIDPCPTIAGVVRDLPRGASSEYVRHLVDGLRKAGMPEE